VAGFTKPELAHTLVPLGALTRGALHAFFHRRHRRAAQHDQPRLRHRVRKGGAQSGRQRRLVGFFVAFKLIKYY
jgi:hypothetical protein